MSHWNSPKPPSVIVPVARNFVFTLGPLSSGSVATGRYVALISPEKDMSAIVGDVMSGARGPSRVSLGRHLTCGCVREWDFRATFAGSREQNAPLIRCHGDRVGQGGEGRHVHTVELRDLPRRLPRRRHR